MAKLFNNTLNTTASSREYLDINDDIWNVATTVLESTSFVCSCVALLFNLSTIIAIISSKLNKKITYSFLTSLSVSNAMIALVMGMGFISAKYLSGETKEYINISMYNIYQIGSMACALTYTAISADLFVQIILPFKYESLNWVFKLSLIVIWLIPFILTESIQFGVTLFNRMPNETFLNTYFRLHDNTLGYLNTGLALVSLVVIVCLNLSVLKRVHRLLKTRPVKGKTFKRSTITVVAMVTTYVVFYLPNWILGIIFVLHIKFGVPILTSFTGNQRKFLISVMTNLKILNTISDPLIYVLRIKAFQKSYKNLLLRLKCYKPEKSSRSQT